MEEPIIIVDGSDVEIYLSVSDAESSLEALDVKYGHFVVYDAGGDVLDLRVSKKNTVVISNSIEKQNECDALANSIIKYLVYVGQNKDMLERLSLDKLITELLVVFDL